VDQQVKERIESLQNGWVKGQTGQGCGRGKIIDETAGSGIDVVYSANFAAENCFGRQQPATIRNFPCGSPSLADAIPEAVEIRRIGKNAADPDDSD
jgi:hypothetical protein